MTQRRTLATFVTAVAIAVSGLVATAPAAQAVDEPVCEYSIAKFPDQCMSEELYEYVTELQADDLAQRIRAGNAEADAYQLRTEMWQMATDLQVARQATSIAAADRAEALAQLERVNVVIGTLRAKVLVLRSRIKKLKQQLPFSAV